MFNPQEHMMDLKGKQYLQVMWRLVWFREEHPDWSIQTVLCDHDREKQTAIFKAEIYDRERILSTGWGSESVKDFKDYLEKAETKAVGRALAMLGYGTQFAPELDEEARIVDSPVERKQPRPTPCYSKPNLQGKIAEIHNLCERLDVNKGRLAGMYKLQSINDTDDRTADAILTALRNEVEKRDAERHDPKPDTGAPEA